LIQSLTHGPLEFPDAKKNFFCFIGDLWAEDDRAQNTKVARGLTLLVMEL